jgi:putative FmdB family regulatory protein
MPIYEFSCRRCGTRFEDLVSAENASELVCPHCGSEQLERLFSSFATEWKPSIVKWHRMP